MYTALCMWENLSVMVLSNGVLLRFSTSKSIFQLTLIRISDNDPLDATWSWEHSFYPPPEQEKTCITPWKIWFQLIKKYSFKGEVL